MNYIIELRYLNNKVAYYMDSHSFKQLQSLKTQLLESPRSPDQFEFDQLLGEPVDQLIIRPVASLRTFQVRQNKMKRLFY